MGQLIPYKRPLLIHFLTLNELCLPSRKKSTKLQEIFQFQKSNINNSNCLKDKINVQNLKSYYWSFVPSLAASNYFSSICTTSGKRFQLRDLVYLEYKNIF